MAATLVLETNAFGRGGSSPSSGTKSSLTIRATVLRKVPAVWTATGFETQDGM